MTEHEASSGPIRGGVDRLRSTGEALRGEGRGWLLVAVALGWLLTLGTRFVIPAVLPQIKASFSVDNATAGFAVTLIWLTYGLMQFPAGALVDRLGERTLLSGSMIVGAGSLALLGVVPTFLAFLVGCVAFGLGTGLYGPPRATVLSNTYRNNDGTAFGVVLAAGNVGSAALPVIGSVIAVQFDWRLALGLLAVPFFAVGVAMRRVVPVSTTGSPDRTRSPREYAGDLRAAVTRRPVVVALAAMTFVIFAMQGLTAFLPTYLVEVKGLSPSVAGTLFAAFFAVGAATKLVAGGAADRYGHRTVLTAIAAASVLPLVALPLTNGLVPLLALAVVLGIRLGIGPVNNAYMVRVIPADVQGTAWGLARALFFMLGATGSVFVGALADRGLFDESFYVLAGLTALAAALYYYLPPRDEHATG